MKTPLESDMAGLIKQFMDRTSNEALKSHTCACCALEIEASQILDTPLDSIPNRHLLEPTAPHPEHDIFNSMLLEPTSVDPLRKRANMYRDCYNSLEHEKIPALSLANNMWIGCLPSCLQLLTLVERLLIAKYLPTAYIMKLYPKQAGESHWDPSQLYSGFKGSVSTYALDPNLVASMIDGKILPVSPAILSAAVGVTFITPKGKTQFSLPKILHVRRRLIWEALRWLKEHNPLYKDIIISEERLELLPEDGIPVEIQAMVRHSTDIDSVIREHEGYVPSDMVDEVQEDVTPESKMTGERILLMFEIAYHWQILV